MSINKELIEMGLIFKEEDYGKIAQISEFLACTDFKSSISEKLNNKFQNDWIDTSKMITERLISISNNNY